MFVRDCRIFQNNDWFSLIMARIIKFPRVGQSVEAGPATLIHITSCVAVSVGL